MISAKKVIIIGGGIGGLTLANALRSQSIEAHVVEAARRSDRLGTGITLLGNSLRALESVGLADLALKNGFGWETVTVFDADGNRLNTTTMPRKWHPDRPASIGIMRPVLGDLLERHALAAGARIDFDARAETIEQDGDGVTVTLTDGEVVLGDLLVAADGTYSTTRARVFGDAYKPSYAGQGAWRYTAPRPKSMTGLELYRPRPGHAAGGCLPLSDEQCYYFFLENAPDKSFRIPPEEVHSYLRKRFEPFTAPDMVAAAALIDGSRHISYRPFDIFLMPQPWNRGRVVLLGDAAHALTPQLTSGGGMAMEDAIVLAEELGRNDSVVSALSAYSIRRGDRVGKIFETSLAISRLEANPTPDTMMPTIELTRRGHELLAEPF